METPGTSSAQDSNRLQYAPTGPWHARPVVRKVARWVFAVHILFVVALVTWAAGRRAFMLHYQKQALAFTAPPGEIAFTNDPAEATKLLRSGSDYVPGIGVPGVAMRSIPPLRRLSEIEDEQYPFGYAFSHLRAAEGGPDRLVKVCLPFVQTGGSRVLYLEARLRPVFTTVGVNGGLRSTSFGKTESLTIPLKPADRFKLFAGQPDPADASHFTFTYELNTLPGTLDGWLMRDDTVKIEPRDGPLRDRRP